jgi:hypothetical protein
MVVENSELKLLYMPVHLKISPAKMPLFLTGILPSCIYTLFKEAIYEKSEGFKNT